MYIDQTIIDLAKQRDEHLAASIRMFDKFGCVGFEKAPLYEETKTFLKDNKVEYETSGRLFLWSPNLSDNLRKTFKAK